jgi:hypothetical protein
MIDSKTAYDPPRRELRVTENFLESPNDESFTEVFLVFTPQLVSFFRSHGCGPDLSEDLSQEVMLSGISEIEADSRSYAFPFLAIYNWASRALPALQKAMAPKRTGLIWRA